MLSGHVLNEWMCPLYTHVQEAEVDKPKGSPPVHASTAEHLLCWHRVMDIVLDTALCVTVQCRRQAEHMNK